MLFELSSDFWRAFYDHVAFAYDAVLNAGAWLHMGSEGRVRRDVIGTLKLAAGAKVLEIGCGTASNRTFLPAGIHYVGVDISRNMLKVATVKCAKSGFVADLVQAEAEALPFTHGFADLALAMGVLQHLRNPEEAIGQIEEVAKPSAMILIIDERRSLSRILPKRELSKSTPKLMGEYFIVERSVAK
jgi:ubiquinone/menaquinone biosynthesis C-methylase UbiE